MLDGIAMLICLPFFFVFKVSRFSFNCYVMHNKVLRDPYLLFLINAPWHYEEFPNCLKRDTIGSLVLNLGKIIVHCKSR